MTRQQAIEFLKNKPAKFGHMLGFTKLNDLHNSWIRQMLIGQEDMTLQASRGTYKTTCVSVALALILVLLPNKRVLFVRKTDNDVKEVIRQVQKILSDPHTLYFVQQIYNTNLRMPIQSATEVTTNLTTVVKGTAQLVGIGTGASLTGKHFDYIFTDDIINLQDRISKAERDHTKLIYQELQNIKNRGGRIVNTGTPWHVEDAFILMPEPQKYDCYHPEIKKIISEDELAAIKQSMLPSLFAANYELRHIASEDVIFTDPQTNADPVNIQQARFCHIDAAYGGEDYTAFTICRKVDGKYYVLGKLWHKHVDECESMIIDLRNSHNAGRIYCETNADKGYLAKELRKRGERVVEYAESMNKFVKITSYLKGAWKDIVFVAGTDDAYIQQVCDFNENAEHDDAPDSLASMIRILWTQQDEDKRYKPLFMM